MKAGGLPARKPGRSWQRRQPRARVWGPGKRTPGDDGQGRPPPPKQATQPPSARRSRRSPGQIAWERPSQGRVRAGRRATRGTAVPSPCCAAAPQGPALNSETGLGGVKKFLQLLNLQLLTFYCFLKLLKEREVYQVIESLAQGTSGDVLFLTKPVLLPVKWASECSTPQRGGAGGLGEAGWGRERRPVRCHSPNSRVWGECYLSQTSRAVRGQVKITNFSLKEKNIFI